MRPRTLSIFALAALIGAAIAVLPALAAAPAAVKLQVNQNCVEPEWPCWTAETSGANPRPASKVTIAAGGQVEFVEHDASTPAGVNWSGTAPACTGVPTTATLNWEGSCKFEQPGIYKFESATMFEDAYENYKKYEVVVEGSSGPPTTGTTGEGGSTPSTTTPSPNPVGEKPTGSPLAGAPTIHSNQRGTTVKGSLRIAKAGAGDRLDVDLLASAASLAKAGHATQVVGRFVNKSVSAGQLSFAVKLNARARKALKRHHHLKLQVKITLTPVHGEAMSIVKSVTVHV